MALTCRVLDADEALAWGLVTHVVPRERLVEEARGDGQRHRGVSAEKSTRLNKRLIWRSLQLSLPDCLELSAAFQAIVQNTADQKEAVAALLEKRPPRLRRRLSGSLKLRAGDQTEFSAGSRTAKSLERLDRGRRSDRRGEEAVQLAGKVAVRHAHALAGEPRRKGEAVVAQRIDSRRQEIAGCDAGERAANSGEARQSVRSSARRDSGRGTRPWSGR